MVAARWKAMWSRISFGTACKNAGMTGYEKDIREQLGHGSEQRYFYRGGVEARLPVSVVRHAGDCPSCPAEIIARRPGSVLRKP